MLQLGIPQGEKGDKGDTGTGVPDGGEPGQLLSKTDDGTAWVDPPSGNVLTGTATGKVAHAEDAFAEKPREVRIKGRTVKNLWPVINGSSNGITVSTDETGLITVSGTATADAYITSGAIDGAKPNTVYTLMTSGLPSGAYAYAESRDADGASLSSIATTTTTTGTTDAEMAELVAIIGVSNGTTVNASFRVMLVEGSEAPDCFTPTGVHGVEAEKLLMAGKNLLRLLPDLAPLTTNGVTFTPQDDGGILVDGTATRTAYYNLDFNYGTTTATATTTTTPCLNGQTVTMSGYTSNISVQVGCFTDVASRQYENVCTRGTPTGVIPPDGRALRSFLEVVAGTTVDNVTVYPQLELGSTATAYEPPDVTEVALPEMDAPLMSVGDHADELVIEEDGSARVELHVERADISEETLVNGLFIPASGYDKPYFDCSLGIRPYPSYEASVEDGLTNSSSSSSSSRYVFIGRWQNAPEGVTRGLYRTWNSVVFWDEEFTDDVQACQLILSGGGSVLAQVPETTDQLGTVQLPQLPAPTFNAYPTGGYVPSDTSVGYERDVNIAYEQLEAKISALNVAQATS